MRARQVFALLFTGVALYAQSPGRRPSRPSDAKTLRGAAAGLLGWRVAVPIGSFPSTTFADAAGKIDALGTAFLAADSSRLDYNLPPAGQTAIKDRLSELRLRMLLYRVANLPADRKLFEFAKNLNIDTLAGTADAATLPALDKLATEFAINVALENNPAKILPALAGLSSRIGLRITAASGDPAPLKDRLLAIDLGNRASRSAEFLLRVSKLYPPAAPEWPPKCRDCAGPRVEVKPLVITADIASAADLAAVEQAMRPAMGYRVGEIGRKTPITSTAQIPAAEKQAIATGLPKQALAKPKKPRKLLVIDLCPQGGFYHTTVAHANYALELLGKNTGAFEPVFSNDPDNLKYPRIKQFDAVFLNSVVGDLFPDPAVLGGLMRFVREGGGLAGIHGSTYASMNLPEYGDLIGAWDGPHAVEKKILKVDDPNSPLTRAFAGKGIEYTDEFYNFLPDGPYSREKLHILLSVDTAKSDMRRGNVRPDGDYGLTWIKNYGKGRVFNCAMGHTPTLFSTPALAEHILAGIQFVLGDLEADATPSARLK